MKPQNRGESESESVFSARGDFNNQKIPPAVITFVQFMAVHVYNISVMFLRAESPEWLIHASAGEVSLNIIKCCSTVFGIPEKICSDQKQWRI